MARRFACLDLSDGARDFRPVALEPGVPALDRPGTNAQIMYRWLGRFAANPEWDGNSVSFYALDQEGGRLASVDKCRPVTAKRLRGALSGELDALKQRIDEVRPTGRVEQMIHRTMTEAFGKLVADPDRAGVDCHFFEYRDARGQCRLVWCWGYRRVGQQIAPAVLCGNPKCRTLFVDVPDGGAKCPACNRVPGTPWKRFAVAAGAFLLLGVVAGYWWSTRPTAVLRGCVAAAEDKQPVSGAEIRLVGTDRTCKTDDEGNFLLDRMRAGTADLRVSGPGFESKTVAVEMTRDKETWSEVLLQGGAAPNGRVVDIATAGPVADARVSIPGTSHNPVLSDKEGKFRLPGVDAKSVEILVEAHGYVNGKVTWSGQSEPMLVELSGSAALAGQVLSDATGGAVASANVRVPGTKLSVQTDEAGKFRLTPLQAVSTELEVRAEGFAVHQAAIDLQPGDIGEITIRLVGGAELAGTVVDAGSGNPVAGAEVSVEGTSLDVRTDANGRYRLSGIPIGQVTLTANAAGYRHARQTLLLGPEDGAPLDFRLSGAGTSVGLVVWAGGEKSLPVPGAVVSVLGTDISVTADEQGEFDLAGLSPGLVTVEATAHGFRAASVEIDPGADDGRPLRIELTGDSSVNGRVVDAAYDPPRPLEGTTVRIESSPLEATTNAAGEFSFEGVRSGAMRILASKPGYTLGEAAAELVTGQPGQIGDVPLAGDATVSFTVLEETTNRPVAGATVGIVGTRLTAMTDAQGRCDLAGVPSRQPWQMAVAAPKYFGWQDEKTFDNGKSPLPVSLARETTLTVVAVDSADGKTRISGAEVRLPEYDRTATTGPDGRAEFPKVPARLVRLEASAEHFCTKEARAQLTPEAASVIVPLLREASLTVKVVHQVDAKVPVLGAEVILVEAGKTERTDAEGKCRFSGITPGPATIKVSAAGFHALQKGPAKLRPGEQTTEMQLQGTADVRIDVVNGSDGATPVARAEVRVEFSGVSRPLSPDSTGAYRLSGLPAGPFKVSAVAQGFFPEQVVQRLQAGDNRITLPLHPKTDLTVTVADAGTSRPIRNALARVSPAGKEARTDVAGRAVFREIPSRETGITVSAPGYCDTRITRQLQPGADTVRVPMKRGFALSGEVINALNGKVLANATVRISSVDDPSLVWTTTTDARGRYTRAGIPSGRVKVSVGSRNFNTLEVVEDVSASTAGSIIRTVLNPTLARGEMRWVLTWGQTPRDLDIHLVGMPRGGGQTHVYHANRNEGPARLDVDSKKGQGPETITVTRPPSGIYRCLVDDAARIGALPRSRAQVKVYYSGGNEVKTFTVIRAPGRGGVWHACDVHVDAGGQITNISPGSGYIKDVPPE